MTLTDVVEAFQAMGWANLSLGTLFAGGLVYVLFWPDKAKVLSGILLSGVGRIFHQVDKRAVALRVEGEINDATKNLLKNAPDVIDGELKIKWAKGDEAAAIVREGNVVVIMRRSEFHEENVAHALMAYLPRSVLSVARHYVNAETMRAVDLTLAKSILARGDRRSGSLDFLIEKHVEPARKASQQLSDRLVAIDDIDLHGWLSRVLLAEYARLGQVMYPGARDDRFESEAEELVNWLHQLARRAPGETCALEYRGRFFKVAVVLVATSFKLMGEGLDPYTRRVVKLLYKQQFDVVYLMGRDENIPAVRAVAQALRSHGQVAPAQPYEYDLRSDFAAKRLAKKRAICIALVKSSPEDRQVVNDATRDEPLDDAIPTDVFEPVIPDSRGPTPAVFPFQVAEGVVAELERVKGFGFIETAQKRIFFHSSQLVDASFGDIHVGDRVIYRRGFDAKKNKAQAEMVKLLPKKGN